MREENKKEGEGEGEEGEDYVKVGREEEEE
jgi:hypothetical protein